jgi:hypothetical protein
MPNAKAESSWFEKRSTELTPKSHHDFILTHIQDIVLSLSKDDIWI